MTKYQLSTGEFTNEDILGGRSTVDSPPCAEHVPWRHEPGTSQDTVVSVTVTILE